MSFPWFSTAKYSALALFSSCLGAGVCLLTHQKREEQQIKPVVDLPKEETEEQLAEKLKQIEQQQQIEVAKTQFDLASRKNLFYARILVCFKGEQERLRKAREYNNEYWPFWYTKQDETHRYNECVEKYPIPKE